jgi:hypothetical protein
LDLPQYESLNTQVLRVSTDVVEALHAFAEELRLTYPLLSDFSRETVQRYGVMIDDPHALSLAWPSARTSSSIGTASSAISRLWLIRTARSTPRRFLPPCSRSWPEPGNSHARKNKPRHNLRGLRRVW